MFSREAMVSLAFSSSVLRWAMRCTIYFLSELRLSVCRDKTEYMFTTDGITVVLIVL
jgi:hypothetical protein